MMRQRISDALRPIRAKKSRKVARAQVVLVTRQGVRARKKSVRMTATMNTDKRARRRRKMTS